LARILKGKISNYLELYLRDGSEIGIQKNFTTLLFVLVVSD
jgi:hypothetical protein